MSTLEPRPIRIGHDDRERAVRALGDHFSQGRLDPDEFEDRVARAYAARTTTDLDVLFADLPHPGAAAVPVLPVARTSRIPPPPTVASR